MNTQTGEYEQYVTPRIDKPFCIAGGKEFHHSGESAYRKAIIALEPNIVGGGFRITVTIQHETEKTVVIEDYTYPSSLQYTENGLPFQLVAGEYPTVVSLFESTQTELALERPSKHGDRFHGIDGAAHGLHEYYPESTNNPLVRG